MGHFLFEISNIICCILLVVFWFFVNRHKDFQNGIGFDLEEEFRKLLQMHWTPKLHKTPVSERFIIGSKLSSLKPLGKAVTKIFKVIFHFKRRYYKKTGFFSGYRNFWCVDKNSDITDTLDQLNKNGKARYFYTLN